MLAPVTGLVQTAQTPPVTGFAWDPDPGADTYLVGVDAQAPVVVAAVSASVTAAPGAHTLNVAPALTGDPAEAVLGFTVPGPPPPPPGGQNLTPVLVGAAILGAAALLAATRKGNR